jgi:hypothetical protein
MPCNSWLEKSKANEANRGTFFLFADVTQSDRLVDVFRQSGMEVEEIKEIINGK